ncbi:Rrf2 family transcriptional regulator [Natrarchaeobius oligotrophus]|uniref:TrmB family transcriptional regulator n=1 Tax=Natrarchaeobius chitinivorans TaxID=1679083 RepID=A0A3N6M861_NATCH|nr:Rrf2 family transcriptional regulator [Natrarchaeobius chitinivorans]RQG96854.1 TrmB family transcriptional regulator [Natrarchaeobius chitinivorans]
MVEIELTTSQRTILSVLINNARDDERPVPARTIASHVDRQPRTVRNQMSNLVDLGLVESVSGPRGGYQPTEAAYEVLDRHPVDDPEMAVLARDFDRVDAVVDSITFTNVHHPETCQARIRFGESVQRLAQGDPIAIGVQPNAELLLAGVIEAVEPTKNLILLDVMQLEASSAS